MFISIQTEEYLKEKKLIASQYQPNDDEKKELARVIRDYTHAEGIKKSPKWMFNDVSVEQCYMDNLKAVNQYVPPKSTNREDNWRAQTIRPMTRKEVIKLSAKITASILAPQVFAYNDDNDEDRESAQVMLELIQWVVDNSQYREVFFNAIYDSLVAPVSYVYQEYCNGKFVFQNVPLTEIHIGNEYIYNIQDQPYIFRTRDIDYVTAKKKWGKQENFKYVRPGVQNVISNDTHIYYAEVSPTNSDRLVNETIYWNKNEKIVRVYINGILIKSAPMSKESYPFVKLGYELIDGGNFAYYMSLVQKLKPSQQVLDETYNLALDGTILNNTPPAAIYGEQTFDTGIISPGIIIPLSNPNSKIEAFMPRADVGSTWAAIQRIEAEMIASSGADSNVSSPSMTAYQTAVLEERDKIQLGLFGKMVSNFVLDLGNLIVDDILRHLTVGKVMDIVGDNDLLKYQTFLVGDLAQGSTSKIQFFDINQETITEEELLMEKLKILTEEKSKNQKIYKVNPALFRDRKYKLRMSADAIFSPSGGMLRAYNLEGYDRMINNPLIANDLESLGNVTRDLLVSQYKPGAVDKYVPGVNKINKMIQSQEQQAVAGQGDQPMQGGRQGNAQGVDDIMPDTDRQKQESLNKSVSNL
jgi:hypothetical protein